MALDDMSSGNLYFELDLVGLKQMPNDPHRGRGHDKNETMAFQNFSGVIGVSASVAARGFYLRTDWQKP
jgi:hypothetical protein